MALPGTRNVQGAISKAVTVALTIGAAAAIATVAEKKPPTVLYHYTDYDGWKGIMTSGVIKPSLKSGGDAIFGNGVYLTNAVPGTGTRAGLAESLFGPLNQKRFQKTGVFIAIDVSGLPIRSTANGYVYVYERAGGFAPLSLAGRMVDQGVNPAPRGRVPDIW